MTDEQWYGAPIQIERRAESALPWSCPIDCTCGFCVKLAPVPDEEVIELEY